MRLLVLIALLSSSYHTHGQGLNYAIDSDGEISFSFSEDFIKEKKIKQIDFSFSKKRPNDVIKPQHENSKKMCFLESGQLCEYKSNTYISSAKINTHIRYFYENELLAQKLELDHTGYFSEFYTYHGDTCHVNAYRSSDYTSSTRSARDSTFIVSRSLVEEENIEKYLNSKSIETHRKSFTYDSLGLLQREFTQHTFSPLLIDKLYDYDQNGNVSEIELATIKNSKKFNFIYDNLSSLQTIEYYLNDKLVTKYEIVYNSDGWVSAFLEHDVDSHVIRIEELEYTFYE